MARIWADEINPEVQDAPAAPPGPKTRRIWADSPEAQPKREDQPWYKSLLHGATQFGFDATSVLGAGLDILAGPTQLPERRRMEPGEYGAIQQEPDKWPMLHVSEKTRDEVNKSFGLAGFYQEPVSPNERALSGVGRSALMLPVAAVGLGPFGVAGEIAATATAPFVGEHVTDALTKPGEKPGPLAIGAGVAAETAASLPAVVAGGPRTAVRGVQKLRALHLEKTATPEIKNILSKLNSRAARMWDAMYRGTKEAGHLKPPQFTLSDLYDAAAYYKGKFPVDPDGNLDFARIAADALDNSLKKSPGPGGLRPSQALRNEALRSHEMALAKVPGSGSKWSQVVSGQQDILERSVRQQFVDSLRKGTPQRFVQGAQKSIERQADRARTAWKALDFDAMPKVKISLIEKEAQNILANSEFQEDLVPGIITQLAEGRRGSSGTYLNMQAVQNLRSRLGAIIAEGDAGQKGITAIKARELRDGLDEIIDGVFTRNKNGRNAYGQIIDPGKKKQFKQWVDARAEWKAYKDLTDVDRVSGGDMIRLLNSKNPSIKIGATAVASVPDAQRALRLAKSDRHTRAALDRSVQEYLLGHPDPNSTTGFTRSPQSIRNTLDQYGDGVKEILGDQYVKDLHEMLDLVESARPGVMRDTDKIKAVNAEIMNNWIKRAFIAVRIGIGDTRGAVRASVGEFLFNEIPSDAHAQFLLHTIAPDRELMRDVLRLDGKVDPTNVMLRLQRRVRLVQNQSRAPLAIRRQTDRSNTDIILNEDRNGDTER